MDFTFSRPKALKWIPNNIPYWYWHWFIFTDDDRQALINTLPKIQNSAEKYIGLICGELVTFVLNAVFKAVPKKEIFAA